jgi:hypothetical protein
MRELIVFEQIKEDHEERRDRVAPLKPLLCDVAEWKLISSASSDTKRWRSRAHMPDDTDGDPFDSFLWSVDLCRGALRGRLRG